MWILVIIAIVIIAFIIWLAKSGRIIVNKSNAPDSDSPKASLVVETSISVKTSKKYVEMQEDDNFEDSYSYEADYLMDKYENTCGEAETAFYDMFDLSKRIKLLEKAISTYDEWKNFCYEKGDAGKRYFEDAYSAASKRPYSPVERDMSGEYVGEYENADFTDIEFLKSVLEYYTSHPDEAKAHLHDEYIFYCGGPDEYEFLMKVQSLPKDLLKIIKQNDCIMQKELYGMFDERMKSHIQKAVKELSAKGKVIAVKSGNSYMLTIRK